MNKPPPRPDFLFLLSMLLTIIGFVLMVVSICLDSSTFLVSGVVVAGIGLVINFYPSKTPKKHP